MKSIIVVAVIASTIGSVIGFSLRQVDQPAHAGAEAQSAKVQRVKEIYIRDQLHIIFRMQVLTVDELRDTEAQIKAVCENVRLTVPSSPFRGSPPSCPPLRPTGD